MLVSCAPRGKRFEDYLEAIYVVEREKGVARVRDIARILGVSPATVVEHLSRLAKKGLVSYEKREFIRLTEEGRRVAERVYGYHTVLRRFLREVLMLPDEIADADACYIEHGVHEETVRRIKKLIEFLESSCSNDIRERLRDKLSRTDSGFE